NHRHAHAVQTARDLVRVAVELATRVQRRHDHFHRGAVLGGVDVDGNAAAVVLDTHVQVLVDDDFDVAAVAGQRLVDRVVDDFVDEMVNAVDVGAADVHGGALAN